MRAVSASDNRVFLVPLGVRVGYRPRDLKSAFPFVHPDTAGQAISHLLSWENGAAPQNEATPFVYEILPNHLGAVCILYIHTEGLVAVAGFSDQKSYSADRSHQHADSSFRYTLRRIRQIVSGILIDLIFRKRKWYR